MGYYSTYELEVVVPNPKYADIITKYLQGRDEQYYGLDVFNPDEKDEGEEYVISFGYSDAVKWYDYELDMREISKRFPNALFIMTIQGEEPGDYRRSYLKGGKYYTVEAQFPDFNPKKLA